jgi:hypothetical protein
VYVIVRPVDPYVSLDIWVRLPSAESASLRSGMLPAKESHEKSSELIGEDLS